MMAGQYHTTTVMKNHWLDDHAIAKELLQAGVWCRQPRDHVSHRGAQDHLAEDGQGFWQLR
jgi:hypothetical protein